VGEERGRIDDLIGIDVDFRFPLCQRGFFIHGLHIHNSQQPARTVHLRFPLPDIRKGRCMAGCMYRWMGGWGAGDEQLIIDCLMVGCFGVGLRARGLSLSVWVYMYALVGGFIFRWVDRLMNE